jgi:hypothetical protein
VVIWEIRDPLPAVRDGTEDPGVDDKRLMIVEQEFGALLTVAGREGGVLSPILRASWDGGSLRHTVKRQPCRTTVSHVSLIGHITPEELGDKLRKTEMSNGLGNRILWCCAKRSKLLPHGGSLTPEDLGALSERLARIRRDFEGVRDIGTDLEFRARWEKEYPRLTEDRPGLLGAVTGRAAAQVRRLALLHAVLDESRIQRARHLEAALALWDYCERSAAYLFRDMTGNRVADKILGKLRESPSGLTRTDIRNVFSNHRGEAEIEQALFALRILGVAEMRKEATRGRPKERWFPVRPKRPNTVASDSQATSVASVAA